MKAVSETPGTWFGLQLFVTLQFPPAVLVQVMVAACVTLAMASNTSTMEKQLNLVFIKDAGFSHNIPTARKSDSPCGNLGNGRPGLGHDRVEICVVFSILLVPSLQTNDLSK